MPLSSSERASVETVSLLSSTDCWLAAESRGVNDPSSSARPTHFPALASAMLRETFGVLDS